MNEIIDETHSEYARVFRKLITLYLDNRDLILMGGYVQGQDVDLDIAMQLWPSIVKFLKQNDGELASFSQSVEDLKNLIGGNR